MQYHLDLLVQRGILATQPTSTLCVINFGFNARFFIFSTRISNELGAGRPDGAQLSVRALMLLAGVCALVVSSCVFASRDVFGYIFSNEKEVVDYVAYMAPLLCLSIITDNLQGCLSGNNHLLPRGLP